MNAGFPSQDRAARRVVRPVSIALIFLAVVATLLGGEVASAFGATSPTTTPQAGAKDVTFGIQPATGTKPDGRGYFDFGATPASQLVDHVAVQNFSYKPLTLAVSATDAANTAEGNFALKGQTAPSRDVGTWITIDPAQQTVTVPPRSYVIVPFLLKVPKGANPGDHAGGILATLESRVTSPSGQNLKLLQNVGTRVFVRVSGPLHPGFTVQNLQASYAGTANPAGKGTVTFTFVVHNTGNVALGGKQTIWVSGLFSSTYVHALPQIQLLLPGSTIKEAVKIGGVFPQVRMTAHVSISPLVIPGSVEPPSGPYTGSVSFWAIPWTLFAIIAATIGGAVLWFLRRRRRNPPERPTGPDGDRPAAGTEDEPATGNGPAEAGSPDGGAAEGPGDGSAAPGGTPPPEIPAPRTPAVAVGDGEAG